MIDLSIVCVFVVYSVWVGFRSRREASRNLDEYFLAGRSMRGWQAGMSMAATQFAADTPLLVMGMLAIGGPARLWRLWIYGLSFLLMGFVLSGPWQRAGVLTDAELTMIRYSSRGALLLRVLKAIYYGTVVNCAVLAFVLVAAVRIFEIFLPWHEWLPVSLYQPLLEAVSASGFEMTSGVTGLGPLVATTNNVISIVAMLGFVALYSTTGGLRSVIATDVMQLAFMMVGTAAYAWFATRAAGGGDTMLASLQEIYGSDAARFTSFVPPASEAWSGFFVIVGLQWIYQLNSDGTGYLAQRTMACADVRQARIAAVTFTFVQITLRSLLWLVIGIALLVVYPFDPSTPTGETFIAGRELLFAQGIDELLPVGIRGLMLTAMLAALASTLDTHLNWGASYWSNDLYRGWWEEHVRQREPDPRLEVLVARLSNAVLIGIALWITVRLGSIQSAWHVSLLFGAGMGAVLVLRWLWERVNLYCEVFAIATSIVAAPVLLLTVESEWARLAAMSAVSTLAVLGAAFFMPATEHHVLEAFYQRVRPPGWWGRAARAVGDDPRVPRARLWRGGVALAACAVSAYGSLIGASLLLLRDDGRLTAIVLLGAAVAAVPIWLRAISAADDGPGV